MTQPITKVDCEARTVFYAAGDENDAIPFIELRTNVTEDGWDTIAFIEATSPDSEAVARHIVHRLNLGDDAEREAASDLHQLLEQNHQIAHLWGVEDVMDVRPDLSEDQAWEVLQTCDRRKDSTMGITWDTIKIIADDLYPFRAE